MSLEIGNFGTRSIPSAYPNAGKAARPEPMEMSSPFGRDGVSFSEEAFQVAELHLNSVLAIQAAQKNPGVEQQYKHGANGNPGSVTWTNGDFKWGK